LQVGEIEPGVGQRRLAREGRLKYLPGLVEAAEVLQRDAEVVAVVGAVRPRLDRAGDQVGGLCGRAFGNQNGTEQIEGIRVRRIDREDVLINQFGLVQPSGAVKGLGAGELFADRAHAAAVIVMVRRIIFAATVAPYEREIDYGRQA
jgi:hypothetical protein